MSQTATWAIKPSGWSRSQHWIQETSNQSKGGGPGGRNQRQQSEPGSQWGSRAGNKAGSGLEQGIQERSQLQGHALSYQRSDVGLQSGLADFLSQSGRVVNQAALLGLICVRRLPGD